MADLEDGEQPIAVGKRSGHGFCGLHRTADGFCSSTHHDMPLGEHDNGKAWEGSTKPRDEGDSHEPMRHGVGLDLLLFCCPLSCNTIVGSYLASAPASVPFMNAIVEVSAGSCIDAE